MLPSIFGFRGWRGCARHSLQTREGGQKDGKWGGRGSSALRSIFHSLQASRLDFLTILWIRGQYCACAFVQYGVHVYES